MPKICNVYLCREMTSESRRIFSFAALYMHLSGSTADEEPLVDGAVDLGGGKVLVGGERGKAVGVDAGVGLLDIDVGAAKCQQTRY
jgi:hypothetical protein